MTSRAIVLDANVLIRAVLGSRVPALLAMHASRVSFLAPQTVFDEARRHLPAVLAKRAASAAAIQASEQKLDALASVIAVIPAASYELLKLKAIARIGPRDPDDWPVLACALLADCPIWTEDRDFFGAGVATWTTARVETYFNESDAGADER
jgi:predicted nucleic acid-binding protein